MQTSNWPARLLATIVVTILTVGMTGCYFASGDTDAGTTWGILTLIACAYIILLGILWGAKDL